MTHDEKVPQESRAGRLLVATPLLADDNFRRTVILVVEDDTEAGTLGVVLNRPTDLAVGQVLEPWASLVTGPQVLFRGGPVAPSSALALARPSGDADPIGWSSLAGPEPMSRVGIMDLGTPPELLTGGLAGLRVFAGYAGWGAGQLEGEIGQGAWYVVDAVPEDAFAAEPGALYRQVLRRQGGHMAFVATYPDDPVQN
jgi:putative transcriptional regulator